MEMRKTISMLLLAMVSSGVEAGWDYVGGNDQFTTYAETTPPRKVGNNMQMWSLKDYEPVRKGFRIVTLTKNGTVYKSSLSQDEYDCKGGQSRTIAVTYHSSRMGKGELLDSSYNVGGWLPIPPNSIASVLLRIACEK